MHGTATIVELLDRALARRAELRARLARESTDSFRVLHGSAEGRAGLSVDLYGRLLLAQTFREPLAAGDLAALESWGRDALGSDVALAWNHRATWPHVPFERWHAPAPEALREHVATELGVRYAIRARHRGQDPWLFLDLRAGRRALAARARGASVLNLFAYTGSAGICAAAHGAREAWNVDFAGSSLDVAARHAELNALPAGVVHEVREDCLPVLRQLAGLPVKGRGALRPFTRLEPRTFDVVVLDPPAWSTSAFGAVDVVRDYPALLKPALLACARGGAVIATNHAPSVARATWRDVIERCAEKSGVALASLEMLEPDEDFPAAGGEPALKIAWITRSPGGGDAVVPLRRSV